MEKIFNKVVYALIIGAFFAFLIKEFFYEPYILRNYGKIIRAVGYLEEGKVPCEGCGQYYYFWVDGIQYEGVGNANSEVSYYIHDSVTVVYNPANPEMNRPANEVLERYRYVK